MLYRQYYVGTQSRNDLRQLNLVPALSFHDWTGQRCRTVHRMTVRFLLEIVRCCQYYQVIKGYK